jgi:DNA-nicking Smr family endonuclease
MGDSDDNSDGLSEADRKIWQRYMNVEAENEAEENFEDLLGGHSVCNLDDDLYQKKEKPDLTQEQKTHTLKKATNTEYQLDKRTQDRLKKGKIPIEARLDLHGMNRTQAHEELNAFLNTCYRKNLRCVLVITGKGKARSSSQDWLTPSKGILKEHVPLWLGQGFLQKIVLKFILAQPQDGGSGALYVYLRKNR